MMGKGIQIIRAKRFPGGYLVRIVVGHAFEPTVFHEESPDQNIIKSKKADRFSPWSKQIRCIQKTNAPYKTTELSTGKT